MAQLLKSLKIRAVNSSQTLLKVIKNPITDHVPVGTKYIALSSKAEKISTLDLAKNNNEQPTMFVIGMVAKGNPSKLKSC